MHLGVEEGVQQLCCLGKYGKYKMSCHYVLVAYTRSTGTPASIQIVIGRKINVVHTILQPY